MSQQTAKIAGDSQRDSGAGNQTDLDHQYGTIGISAVVAALRYSGAAQNPAYAPTCAQANRRSEFDTRSVFAV
jgi:hypothetical protein